MAPRWRLGAGLASRQERLAFSFLLWSERDVKDAMEGVRHAQRARKHLSSRVFGSNSHTIIVGTSFGCAGKPAIPWNSGTPPLLGGHSSSVFGSGSILICGLNVNGEPGLHGEKLVKGSSGSPACERRSSRFC